ncbi:TRAP transporter large permease subunit [Limnohabitans sp. 103DPR2]|uniref:TRAP transporter large permease subunit n=1 Tax=Limnohabitans sp. 103DPR2 TaxID=1678129 RepID=UPI0006DC23DD|nr:TRAP transporter large permease subunit [Limnohabitans sp. 103DPR2]ALK92552.1 Sialic acid TRAP transporter permease protein SiaT [Limnohabitans sp. 103DPR2]
MSDPALGLLMLSLIVVVIMLGFPTAFTLMGLGMAFGFGAFYDPSAPWFDNKIFNLMVQRTFGAMTNDTLLSIPLFVLMGYVMERGALVDKMFHSVQLAFRKLPGSLAVATLVICTFWGIASGLVGAVVVLMGVIAMRPMLNAGYDTRLAAGVITAGGTLGILIPPSVMIIVYAAVAGQSVVKLYAAAMFPGFFLATLYLIYVIGWVLIDPKVAPKLPAEQTRANISPEVQKIADHYAPKYFLALFQALLSPGKVLKKSADSVVVTWGFIAKSFVMSLVPILMTVATMGAVWWYVVIHSQEENNAAAAQVVATQTAQAEAPTAAPAGEANAAPAPVATERSGVQEPPGASDLKEPPGAGGLQEPPGSQGVQEPPGAETVKTASSSQGVQLPPGAESTSAKAEESDAPLQALGDGDTSDAPKTEPVPEGFYLGFWIACGLCAAMLAYYYWHFDAEQYEILNMLVRSVMPLGILTFVVLGVILFGITTATESAAVGAAGAFLMAWSAGTLDFEKIKQAVFLTAKTTSMVCWLFVGSALFSAVFAILGGQRLVEEWVMALNLTPIQFLLLSQAIIFVLGWPLEWTEIIVIFVPIFLPLLAHFQIDPMLWGVMVFVNLQAAFLSPPVAMSAFYLKGVSPPHVTINQIFAGMMPYMFIVILCLILMYIWPELTLWLPNYLYGK